MSGERVIRISADAQERDPLVQQYIAAQRDHCAYRVFSLPHVFMGLVLPLVFAVGTHAVLFGRGLLAQQESVSAMTWARALAGEAWFIAAAMLVATALLAWWAGRSRDHRPPASQEVWLGMWPALFAYGVLYYPDAAIAVVTGCAATIYMVVIAFRLACLLVARHSQGERSEVLAEPADGWPVYTILVPLYKEAAVVVPLMDHLATLDYPRESLDVKLLIEGDDAATLAAIQAHGIPEWMEVCVVPDAQPKTKPRACNHGLQRARGQYVVIYDAEDRPEPDQLKQAAVAFASASEFVACYQAHLAYHNTRQNLLTRWFSLEYNTWFRAYLPGLAALGAPVPLGGTSNHFRVDVLREQDGWDPFNVTEDCDLGVRLYRNGYRTAMLNSVTWEEANSRLGNWLRQRSRWIKGYLVTHVVWCRHPLRLWRDLGCWGTIGFLVSVFGVAGLTVINLLFWGILGWYATALVHDMALGYDLADLLIRDWSGSRGFIGADDPELWSWQSWYMGDFEDPFLRYFSQIFSLVSLSLLAANVAFMVVTAVWGRRGRDQAGLPFVLAVLSVPCYWVLMTLAAWKGLWQLLVRPHYWEKTVHGIAEDEPSLPGR